MRSSGVRHYSFERTGVHSRCTATIAIPQVSWQFDGFRSTDLTVTDASAGSGSAKTFMIRSTREATTEKAARLSRVQAIRPVQVRIFGPYQDPARCRVPQSLRVAAATFSRAVGKNLARSWAAARRILIFVPFRWGNGN